MVGDTGAALGPRIKGKGILATTEAIPYTSLALQGCSLRWFGEKEPYLQEAKEWLKLQTKHGGLIT